MLIIVATFISCRKDVYSGYEGEEFATKFIGTWECKVLKVSLYNKYTWTSQITYEYYPETSGYTVYGEITPDFYYRSYKSDSLIWSGQLSIESFSLSGDTYVMKMADDEYVTVRNDTLRSGHWKDLQSNKYYYQTDYSTFVRK